MTLEERMNELESRQAFQDDSLQSLNEVIYAQQRAIERLELQLAALARRQAELLSQVGEVDAEDVPPPHY